MLFIVYNKIYEVGIILIFIFLMRKLGYKEIICFRLYSKYVVGLGFEFIYFCFREIIIL